MDDSEQGNESPLQPPENSSGWAFNWRGLVQVLVIAVAVVVAWSWLDGFGGSSNAEDDSDRLGSATEPGGSLVDTTPSTVAAPTTTRPPPTTTRPTTTVAPERQVLIKGEMRPCRFGANCLVAGFSIRGFDEHPGRFVCIYPNSRRDFPFNDDDVDVACLTADQGDTITIEVDGVESATISEENLDGT